MLSHIYLRPIPGHIMVVDGLKGNDVDLVSLDHCTEVPQHLTDLDPAAQNYDSCLATLDTG